MMDFKAKMHEIRFRLGLCPIPRWGSLQRSPDPIAGFKGATLRQVRGWAGEEEGKGEGKGREGPKLLLNHGSTVTWGPPSPSEPYYATD